jgi:hypothetical protein
MSIKPAGIASDGRPSIRGAIWKRSVALPCNDQPLLKFRNSSAGTLKQVELFWVFLSLNFSLDTLHAVSPSHIPKWIILSSSTRPSMKGILVVLKISTPLVKRITFLNEKFRDIPR